jgi:hypothetical protein
VLLAGDDSEAKRRITEQLTALTIAINIRHKATAGIGIVGLPEDLASAF